jgi:putative ABC transport system permease protein
VAALRRTVEALPDVEGTKVLVLGQGLARSGSGAVGVAVMGVESSVEARTSPLARRIVAGRFLEDGDDAVVVIGSALAKRLDLAPGKKLVLATNDASGGLVEALFRVRGVFRTGADEIDGYLVQAPLGAVRRLYGFGPDEATRVGVVLRDPDAVGEALAAIRARIPSPEVAVLPWQKVLPELAAFIRLDRTSDTTLQGLLLFLVLFTIFNTVLMSVLERTREFAMLLAVGTSPGWLEGQVLLESAFLGLLGTGLGIALGAAVGGWFQVYGLDISRFYAEGVTISGLALASRIHAKVTLHLVLSVGAIVFAATVLLGIFPMRRAARVPIADVLR